MLEARSIPTTDGRLVADATGEVELNERDVLVLRRIHVRYRLRLEDPASRERAERAHGLHADHCPVARSLSGAIEVTTELHIVGG